MSLSANAQLFKSLSSFDLTAYIALGEDAEKAGFNNLTFGADRFVINPNLNIAHDYKINARSGNDVIGTSAGNDTVYGGSGNDIIDTRRGQDDIHGGSGNDVISGGAHNDAIHGDSGADRIDGGADNDVISGGRGADILTGGSGADMFVFNLGDGVDRITDFTHGQDRIMFGGEILHGLPDTHAGAYDIAAALINVSTRDGVTITTGQFNSTGQLVFNTDTRTLSFDADGRDGDGAAVELMRFDGLDHMEASDIFAPAAF